MSRTEPVLQINGKEGLWPRAIAEETGIRVASCYQCLRCTNSCPVSTFMDIKPHQIVRFAQLGQREKILESSAIWVCLSCEMCSTYCPNEVDVAGLMDHMKNTVVASRRQPAEFEVAVFHDVFLDVLQKHGRIHDLQLIQLFKWKTLRSGAMPPPREVLKDLTLALELFKRKRLKILPDRSRAADEVRRYVRAHRPKGVSQ